MTLILGLLIFAFFATSAAIVPFIDFLYRYKLQRQKQVTTDSMGQRASIFDRFHGHKAGTPIGGGILMIGITTLVFALLFPTLRALGITVTHVYPLSAQLIILFTGMLGFSAIGLYDDLIKIFGFKKNGFFGLRLRHKLFLQLVVALSVGLMMHFWLGINFVHVPFLGQINIGSWFIAYATFVIVAFANAVNITDGLDGLAGGVMLIALIGLWALSTSILDTPMSMLIALLIGTLIAFLYFNVAPARIWMGDMGALGLGAVFAILGLLLGKSLALVVIGGIFVAEVLSSLIQLISKKWLKKKAFPVAPFHLWLQLLGWPEPKIVMRAWMTAIILTALGVWFAML